MTKVAITLFGASLLLLTACSDKAVLVADAGQIGAGAKITRDGKTAQLHVPASATWPKGWDERLTVAESGGIVPGVQELLTFKTTKNAEISFINIGKQYACQSCAFLKLPLHWHLEEK